MALTKVSRGLLSTSIVDNGNATAITIDANENVGIGTSSPSAPIHVNRSGVGEAIRFTDSSTDTGHLEIVSGGGCSLWAGGFLAFGAGGGASYTERMRIDSSGNLILKKNLVLESTSEGIDFSGVGSSAKTLDDYEEGAWNPTVTSSAGTITTVTSPIGTYTKIGRTVIVQYQFNITTLGTASGNIIVSGRPFTEDNSEISYYAGVHRARSGASSITEFDPDGTFQLYGTTPVAGVYLGSMVYNTTS